MSNKLQAIRGMNDILPREITRWQAIESALARCLQSFNYQEIRFPMVESTALFKGSIGEVTDIVEKEMYTFDDLNGDSLTLRPEGTASTVRSCIEHGLLYNQQQKLWYQGPMFRHEKPQKGRYRQFHQLGVEAFGYHTPLIDVELISLSQALLKCIGLGDACVLELNSIGSLEDRVSYRQKLVDYFNQHLESLDEDSKKRLSRNPLRILDSKSDCMQQIIANAPKLLDCLGASSKQHFNEVCEGLDHLGIAYTINPTLVRGIDYYGHTVLEWRTSQLGAQATVCAGGRYDVLVEQLGGEPTPAAGFALGLERLLLLQSVIGINTEQPSCPDIYFISGNQSALQQSLLLANQLRDDIEGVSVHVNCTGSGFKSQFKKADKSGAKIAVIIGDDEFKQRTVSIKWLRGEPNQCTVNQDDLVNHLNQLLQQEQ